MKKVNKINDTILQHIVNQIVRISDPDKIILFGSHATGKATKDSDYDVLILKKYAKKNSLRKKLYRIGLNADAPVDMLVNTHRGFDKLKGKWYYVYYDIAKFGKIVYAKS